MPQLTDTFDDLPILIELRSSLGHAFAVSEHRYPTARSRPKPRRAGNVRGRARRLALAGTLTLAGLTVAGVLGLQGSSLAPAPAVAATMGRLAEIAANQTWDGIPGPGQYLYTKSEAVTLAGDGSHALDQRQIWVPSSGQALLEDPNANLNNKVDTIGGPISYFPTTVAGWQALSSDPATLLGQIHNLDAPHAPDTPAEQFTNVSDALSETPIPPATRAVLYRAVALIPGVRLMGTQTDPTGQTGQGVGYYSGGQLLTELIFDRQTARLLGELTYDQSGHLTSAIAYIEQEIVNNAPEAGSTAPASQFPQFQVATDQGTTTTS